MPPVHPHRLHIEVAGTATGTVLALHGELDAGNAGRLEEMVTRLPPASPLLILDLHELSFVDSLGMNMLFRAREWAQARGIPVRVVRAPVHVHRLLTLAALDGTLGPFYADVDAALRP